VGAFLAAGIARVVALFDIRGHPGKVVNGTRIEKEQLRNFKIAIKQKRKVWKIFVNVKHGRQEWFVHALVLFCWRNSGVKDVALRLLEHPPKVMDSW
jgi:hypothetical protein